MSLQMFGKICLSVPYSFSALCVTQSADVVVAEALDLCPHGEVGAHVAEIGLHEGRHDHLQSRLGVHHHLDTLNQAVASFSCSERK